MKLYVSRRRKLTQLLDIVMIFSVDIKMMFGLDECCVLDLNSAGTPVKT